MLKLENDVLCHCHRCVPRNDNGTNLSVVFRNCQLIHKWLRERHTFFGFALFSHVALSECSFLGSFSECARVGSSFRLSMAFLHLTIRKKHIRPEKRGQRGCLRQKLSCKTSLWKNPSRQAPLSHSCATTLSHQCTPNIFFALQTFQPPQLQSLGSSGYAWRLRRAYIYGKCTDANTCDDKKYLPVVSYENLARVRRKFLWT